MNELMDLFHYVIILNDIWNFSTDSFSASWDLIFQINFNKNQKRKKNLGENFSNNKNFKKAHEKANENKHKGKKVFTKKKNSH